MSKFHRERRSFPWLLVNYTWPKFKKMVWRTKPILLFFKERLPKKVNVYWTWTYTNPWPSRFAAGKNCISDQTCFYVRKMSNKTLLTPPLEVPFLIVIVFFYLQPFIPSSPTLLHYKIDLCCLGIMRRSQFRFKVIPISIVWLWQECFWDQSSCDFNKLSLSWFFRLI